MVRISPLTAEAHAQVGTTPEEVGQGATSGEVSGQPRDIGNSLLAANVCERALVRVLERSHLLDTSQTLLQVLDRSKGLVASLFARCLLLDIGQVGEFHFDVLSLGHLVEQTGEECAFLCSDLSRRSIVCDGAVTDGPDIIGTLDNEVLVDGQTTARLFLCGKLRHQVLDDRAESITGGPDEETVWDLLQNLLSLWAGELGLDVLVGDILDHGLCADLDRLLLEGLFGIVDKLLGKHGENLCVVSAARPT